MVCKRKQHGWKQRIGMLGVVFVFLLQTLAWSAMPVFATGDGDTWVTICSSEGFQRVSLRNSDFPAQPSSSDSSRPASVNYCYLCVFAQGLGTGFEQAQVRTRRAVVSVAKATFVETPAPEAFHTPNQPRAPPVIS